MIVMKQILNKTIFGFVCDALLICVAGTLQAETVDMYLVAGQSNADGRAEKKNLPVKLQAPQKGIKIFANGKWQDLQPGLNHGSNCNWFGPEVTFGLTLKRAYPKRKIVLVKYAVGSTCLGEQWCAPDSSGKNAGPKYVLFMKAIKDAIASLPPKTKVNIRGMIWMQGETDAWFKNPARAKAYKKNLTAFVRSVRKNIKQPELPFVIGRITKNWRHSAIVRPAQEKVNKKVPYTAMVNTDDLPLKSDGAHYNAVGQQKLGKRMGSSIVKLEKKVKH